MNNLTDEQRAIWNDLVDREQAGRSHEEARWNKVFRAARERGFGGELRTAVLRCGRPWDELGAAMGITSERLFAWMSGDETLSEVTIGRLVDELDLHLATVGAADQQK
jgi:hypothetical protein